MADPAPNPVPVPGPDNPPVPPPPAPTPPATDGDEVLGEGGKNALVAERKARKELEARLKELEPLAKAAKEREEAEKTEAQKLNEALAGEREARTTAEAELLRYVIGAEKKVPAELVKFLAGTTKDEVEQSADALLAAVADNRPTMPGRPAERMVNGRPSTSSLDTLDPAALIALGRDQHK
jgi:hypothetical protein